MSRELKDSMQKQVLEGVRWLLLKRPENLDPTRKEPKRPEEALRLNEPPAIAYQLQEELNEIREQDDQETAEALLIDRITCNNIRFSRMNQDSHVPARQPSAPA